MNTENAFRRTPAAPGFPILGSFFELRRDIIDFFMKEHKRLGDVWQFQVLNHDVTMVSDPVMIEQILVRDFENFEKDKGLKLLSRYALGTSLLTAEGEAHKIMRKQSSKAFSRKNINSYASDMVAICNEHTDKWKDGETRDIHEEMMAMTAKIAAMTLFHTRVDEKVNRIGHALHDILNMTGYMISPVIETLMALPLDITYKMKKALQELDDIIYEFIDDHLTQKDEAPDFLANLISAKKEMGIDLSRPENRRQLRDEAMTIFLAGHETTANALTWTWYLLSQNPQAASKLREEIERNYTGSSRNAETVASLPFTTMVFTEAMRLYPPAWVIGRYVRRDYELAGFRLKAGTEVWMSQYIVHRDERWYPEPESFRPERWAGENTNPRFSYFPFGGGPRACIGEQFAWLEASLIIASMTEKFSLSLHPEQKIGLLPQVTLRPRYGMRMDVHRVS